MARERQQHQNGTEIVAANRNALRQAVAAVLAESNGTAPPADLDAITDRVLERLRAVGEVSLAPGPSAALRVGLAPLQPQTVASARAFQDHVARLVRQEAGGKGHKNRRNGHAKAVTARPVTFAWDASEEPEPVLSENARAVLQRRYLAKDRDGKVVEDPKGMFLRVARTIAVVEAAYDPEADVDEWARAYYRLVANLEFVPNSPTLMNAGRELGQLSACFVLPVADSISEIFDAVKYTAQIHKSGGGTGFAFSRLRPEGDVVGSTGGIASGPVSFAKIFDAATEQVKQGGTRRGANMGILHVQHPDILKFIHMKEDNVTLQNFNISVAVTEEFMRAVEEGGDYDLVNPRSGQVTGRLSARDVFRQMTEGAWNTGDPGMVFLDRINAQNPTPALGQIESTNPCGEQPLLPYESCNLGSINLNRVLVPNAAGARSTGSGQAWEVDWDVLGRIVDLSVRFLDNVIDANRYPIPQIAEMSKMTRRIGLGVMGWADILTRMGVPYNSQEALDLAGQIMGFIQERAWKASQDLAEERGPFPAFYGSIYDIPGGRPMRNSAPTTIAPTGTISIIADASSGIEPLFALSYIRNVMDRTRLVEVNRWFEEVARSRGFFSDEIMQRLADAGSCLGMPEVPEDVQRVFVTSHDISPEWHVRMQAAFQAYTDNAVSKTINLPHEATVQDVADAYTLAYRLNCKGITIYRDGSKEEQVLSTGKTARHALSGAEGADQEASPVPASPAAVLPRVPRRRPATLQGVTERVRTGHGNLYVTITFDDEGRPFEVFTNLGKAGGDDAAYLEAVSRLASLSLRSGVDVAQVIDQLRGITCHPTWDEGVQVLSAPDAVALALIRHAIPQDEEREELRRRAQEALGNKDASAAAVEEIREPDAIQPRLFPPRSPQGATAPGERAGATPGLQCPDCYSPLTYAEGCLLCTACGYSKC